MKDKPMARYLSFILLLGCLTAPILAAPPAEIGAWGTWWQELIESITEWFVPNDTQVIDETPWIQPLNGQGDCQPTPCTPPPPPSGPFIDPVG
ncbi:MAG: hypothetical protein AAGD38_00385 [Acidobacteriota bacterium]